MAPTEPYTRGDVSVAVQMGTIAISLVAENVSWAPDVVRDMQNRTMEMLREMLEEAFRYNLIVGEAPESLITVADGEDGDTDG